MCSEVGYEGILLAWNIILPNACTLISLPSFWKLILILLESLGLDEVHSCFWTLNNPIISKGLQDHGNFFSLQKCHLVTPHLILWYQLAMGESFNKFLSNLTSWFSTCKKIKPHVQTAVCLCKFLKMCPSIEEWSKQDCGNCS